MEHSARLQSELKSMQASWERRVGEAQIVALYRRGGIDLPTRNGDGRWSLPMPATYVLDRDGTIVLALVDPDYRRRLEPSAAIGALRPIARPGEPRNPGGPK